MLPILVSHHNLRYPQRYTRQECDQRNNANKSSVPKSRTSPVQGIGLDRLDCLVPRTGLDHLIGGPDWTGLVGLTVQ